MSTVPSQLDTSATEIFDRRMKEIKDRLRRAADDLARRYPEPTIDMKRRGCTEIMWGAVTTRARDTERKLDDTIIAYAEGLVREGVVKQAWREFVQARKRQWKECAPIYEEPLFDGF